MKTKTNKLRAVGSSRLVLEATLDHPQWFFAWVIGKPYVTRICGWNRRAVMMEAVRDQCVKDWKTLYGKGGRIVKVRMSLQNTRAQAVPCENQPTNPTDK